MAKKDELTVPHKSSSQVVRGCTGNIILQMRSRQNAAELAAYFSKILPFFFAFFFFSNLVQVDIWLKPRNLTNRPEKTWICNLYWSENTTGHSQENRLKCDDEMTKSGRNR